MLCQRRICPGRHFAVEFLNITVASVLAVFDITKVTNSDGSIDEPLEKYTSGFIR